MIRHAARPISRPRQQQQSSFAPSGPPAATGHVPTLPAFVAGTLTAFSVAWQVCRLPLPRSLGVLELFFIALTYMLLAALGGEVGLWAVRHLFYKGSVFQTGSRAGGFFVFWFFFPAILLLSWQNSILTVFVMIVASAVAAALLREACPSAMDEVTPGQLKSEKGLFAEPTRATSVPWRSVVISVCVQSAACLLLLRRMIPAGVVLAIGSFLWQWQLTSARLEVPDGESRKEHGARRRTYTVTLATFVTFIALLPKANLRPVDSEIRALLAPRHASSSSAANEPIESSTKDAAYRGIILWPTPKKKEILILPLLPKNPSVRGRPAVPLVIPFDGPYWYFQAPHQDPGQKAHVAHGEATEVNIRSSSWLPLITEAHQNLANSIDLGSYREIRITIANLDNRPGTIGLSVLLTDSSLPSDTSQWLGEQPIVSSAPEHFALKSSATKEVVRFAIPRNGSIQRFDKIKVVFLPDVRRREQSAKISIKQFELIPR